jgi:hypothetical protein
MEPRPGLVDDADMVSAAMDEGRELHARCSMMEKDGWLTRLCRSS